MSGNIEISQTPPGERALEPGQAVFILTNISRPLEDGRVRIYDEARQQFLQSNGRFDDTAQLLEVESVYNDSTTGAASIVISDTLAASMDPDSVVTVEVPAAGIKQKLYWPELLVGQGPPLPPQDGPNHFIETGTDGGISGGSDPVEDEKDKVAQPPPPPPGPAPEPRFELMPIVLALLAGLALGALAVWLVFPPGQTTTQPANQARIDDLQTELSAAQDRAAQAEDELLSVQDRLDAAQDALEQAEADLAQANRSLEDMEAQLDSDEQAAMQRIEDAKAARDQAQRDLDAAQQDAQQAQAAVEAAQDRADAAEAAAAAAQTRAERAQEARQAAEQRARANERRALDAEDALAAAARQSAQETDQRLAAAERALEADRQRVDAAESAAAAAEAEAQRLRDRRGSSETARVRDAEERARQAQIAAEQAERRVNDLQGQLAAANRSSQTAQAATDRAVEERDRAIARAEEAERELARLQTASPPAPTFPMDAQRRACNAPGIFVPVLAYRRATTSGRFLVNQQRSLQALMCERDVPCPEAFKQVLGQDYADNAAVVTSVCRF